MSCVFVIPVILSMVGVNCRSFTPANPSRTRVVKVRMTVTALAAAIAGGTGRLGA
jgi:hypothetical protein